MQDFLKTTIKEAGFLAKGYYEEDVAYSFKFSPTDLVTEADKETNKFLIDKIKEKYPDQSVYLSN